MSERYKAWWEDAGVVEVVVESIFHPRGVYRQLLVTVERGQAPLTSDQETFPTLRPKEAERLLRLWDKEIRMRKEKAGLK